MLTHPLTVFPFEPKMGLEPTTCSLRIQKWLFIQYVII